MPVATTTYTHSRPSYSSTAGPSSPETRKPTKKEDKLILQHGSKLHSYGRDKAPYPFSFDPEVLQLECMDHAFMRNLKGSVSCIDFKDEPPQRCLDLGTGLGDWVIDAAKQWKDCTFVGYDLVNVQIPLMAVDKSISKRVQWAHGNFLRQKLPFEDDEFDYVHIHGIAFGVPENKWYNVFEEIRRVLRPGGMIEVIEEDAVFPILPRWFTAPLHAPRKRRVSLSEEQAETIIPQPMSFDDLPHDHALLESLYYAVFSNRFLNPTPSSTLPSYFTSFFGQVMSPPVVHFPMPPIAPLPPPATIYPSFDESRASIATMPPLRYRSDSSASDFFSASSQPSTPPDSIERSFSSATADSCTSEQSPKSRRLNAQVQFHGTRIGSSKDTLSLFPLCHGEDMNEQTLFMQLKRAVGLVLSAKEAMFDELRERIENREREPEKDELSSLYGWEEEDFEKETSRHIFDRLIDRYREDMHVRVSLWHITERQGWELPKRDALSRAEFIEDQRFRRAIMDAQQHAKDDDMRTPCRKVRLLVGVNVTC